MYDYAAELGLIRDGELPEVRMHGAWFLVAVLKNDRSFLTSLPFLPFVPFSLPPHHPPITHTDQWSAPATTPVAPATTPVAPPPPPPPADVGAVASAAAAAPPPPAATAAPESEAALAATAALLDQAGDLVAKASATAASARARLADITAAVARRSGAPPAAETPARGGGARGGKRTAAARDAGARASAINSKGLRHFSLKVSVCVCVKGKREEWKKASPSPLTLPHPSTLPHPPQVCEKVESKGVTSYNEVADELVAELREAEGAPVPPPSADGAPPLAARSGSRRRV